MAKRVSLRRIGGTGGKLAALPETLADLLALASTKLKLSAMRIFTTAGDELDDDGDLALLDTGEVLYVSAGEDFSSAAAPPLPVAAEPVAAAEPPPLAVGESPPHAAPEPLPLSVAEPPPAEPPPANNPFAVFNIGSAAPEAAAKAAPVARLSEQATRELMQARVDTPFSMMARGGAGGDLGNLFYLKIIQDSGAASNGDLYDFCQNTTKYLEKREAVQEGEGEASDSPQPALLMGEWKPVAVPPDIAKKDKHAAKLAFKPSLSAYKKVYEYQMKREGKVVWEYPPDATLMKMKVTWHDFKSLVSHVRKAFVAEEKKAASAAKAAAKPPSDDRGGVTKLAADFKMHQNERKRKAEEMQREWDARDEEIDAKLKVAHDALARALPDCKEAAQLTVDVLEDERRIFYTARSNKKLQLEEEKRDAKRKHDAQMEAQKSHNKHVKGEGRKQFKVALAARFAAAKERDPDVELAKAWVAAVFDKLLAACAAEPMDVDA